MTFLDSSTAGNVLRHINHSCVANCEARVEYVDGLPALHFYAKEAVQAGQFLSLEYSPAERDFDCCCVSCDSSACCVAASTRPAPLCTVAYTDGSQQSGDAGWGVVVVQRPAYADKASGTQLVAMFGPVDVTPSSPYWLGADELTNNTAELSAIGELLLWYRDHASCSIEYLTIYTDSQYSINCILGRQVATSNVKLVQAVRAIYDSLVDQVELVKVLAHSKDRWNDEADRLADKGRLAFFSLVGRHDAKGKPANPQRVIVGSRPSPQQADSGCSLDDFAAGTVAASDLALCDPAPSPDLLASFLAGDVCSGISATSDNMAIRVVFEAPVLPDLDLDGVAFVTGPRTLDLAQLFLDYSAKASATVQVVQALCGALAGGQEDGGRFAFFGFSRHVDASRQEVQSALTSPDGLCGYRSLFQAYLRHLRKKDPLQACTDPKLWIKGDRDKFAAWVDSRFVAAQGNHMGSKSPDLRIATAHKVVLDFIQSGEADGVRPQFPPYLSESSGGWYSAHWDRLFTQEQSFPFIRLEDLKDGYAVGSVSGSMRLSWRSWVAASAESNYIYYGGAHFWIVPGQPNDQAKTLQALFSLVELVTEAVMTQYPALRPEHRSASNSSPPATTTLSSLMPLRSSPPPATTTPPHTAHNPTATTTSLHTVHNHSPLTVDNFTPKTTGS